MSGKNDLLTSFRKYIANHDLFHPGDHLLVAVSGGVDSVVLCQLCQEAGFRFTMAHCNFMLRSEESERDEDFVRQLAQRHEVHAAIKRFDTSNYAKDNNISIQVAARVLRYEWFNELLKASAAIGNDTIGYLPSQPRYIVTAHHADDNVETVIMNFFKGTGISGLRGILPRQGNLIRPLLFAWKEEILSYARAKDLQFVEDSSNSSDKYTRNYIRNKMIPALQEVYPSVKQNISDSLAHYLDTEVLYQDAIALHHKKLVETRGGDIHIPVLKLKKLPAFQSILYELLRPYQFTPHQCNEAVRLLDSSSGKYVQSLTHRIIRNRNWLIITPISESSSELIVIDEGTREVDFGAGLLELKNLDIAQAGIPSEPNKAVLDASLIKFPLILRRWKQGDYFYPLGMRKKKKISRFLIDQKVSLPDKENTWVLEMDKKIIWVINRRIDDRFKVSASTMEVMRLTFTVTGS